MLITSSAIIAQSTSSSSSRYGLPNRNDFDKWSIGVHVGPNYFQGDIQKNSENNNSLKELPFDLMYGAHVAYQFTHTSAIRAGATFGKFSGESEEAIRSGMKEYLYTYESPVKEYFIDFVFTSGNISYLKRNKKFHLLGSIGIGIFNFDGELKNIDPKIGASPSNPFLAVQTGNVTEGMMTLGLGFKYRLGKRFDAGLTYDFRKTFTDKVDGINKPTTESDNYSMLNLNINYTFGKKNQQMEWVNPVEIVYNDMAELKDKMDLLSGDKDKDGVSDIFDKDNSTPEGVKVYGDGTTVDTDGDGIPDHLDSDPFSTKVQQLMQLVLKLTPMVTEFRTAGILNPIHQKVHLSTFRESQLVITWLLPVVPVPMQADGFLQFSLILINPISNPTSKTVFLLLPACSRKMIS